MELTASELWQRILDFARSSLPEQSFRTWFAETKAVALTDGPEGPELVVETPSAFHQTWLEDKYGDLLAELGERALGRPLGFSFEAGAAADPVPSVRLVDPDEELPAAPSHGGRHGTGADRVRGADRQARARSGGPQRPRPRLNERYSFERFVVGNNNQLASAASHAVAEQPARMYNPLFLYGGVGLGKTHLMHAIGNRILGEHPDHRVLYVSSESFMNELVTAIQDGTTSDFRRRFRRMDLLLVDDVHFLAGKESTQEEFFHTFNALYDARKQIVLTSDRPPKELPGLEDRLVSRFEWGLVVDIKPPDYETRVAILRKKASDDNIQIDDSVIDFIARSCTASVRELEGAVIKLLALSSLRNREVTVELAREALTGMIGGEGRRASPRERLSPEHIK